MFLVTTGLATVVAMMAAGLLLHLCIFHVYINIHDMTTYEYVRAQRQASEEARRCDGEVLFEIDGFSCPGGETFGPQNLLQAHPIYAHPTDCRSYFSCYHNKVGPASHPH